ncbi:hypothetical protein SERLA73DRAFT_180488 [Serpula lacrymans var. lacrymans S7.3]|uniref:Major facilitator superfamily (MFS) profile domain-containing protein n=2 Tax=Serpula lacrymans var. lacrymans TaxID=341189 RepID=F8PUZ8_SERL3|nr:uncharacterized protein SERLADRAFT_466115 [Serpula lacrymans var. lacrymans S7.9]EGO00078.1 hypothetical protein SERLA73DRAFT_180488 [Serpula lacrymans var. lacrymans S7.3]EGO25640.1 hypothetical protein SERLADRAFT_466115 [Serpula lacrymans var. lacrymans S7.9]
MDPNDYYDVKLPNKNSQEDFKQDVFAKFDGAGTDTGYGTSVSTTNEVKEKDDLDVVYRLYRRRFAGLVGFVLLGAVTGMTWPWFGPISTDTATQFGISLDQVNWLGNIVSCIYLPVSLSIPVFCSRYGIRRCCEIGVAMLLISGWIRYAGTIGTLSPESAYALLIVGQLFSAIAQPIFQVLGPIYSEKWFDLRGRTTATMIIAVANPVGGALGQVLSPSVGTARQSILVLAIISTAVTPAVFLINSSPATPPTHAGSQKPQEMTSLLRAMVGFKCPPEAHMTLRERIDFMIVIIIFGVLAGMANTFSILSAQYMEPAGYSADVSGYMGATLLLSGLVASIISAPLFDRVLTHQLALTVKILVPIVAGCWLSLIWAVTPNNTAALFVIMALIGCCSITMLPVGLELGCELTRNADGSSALLWCSCNLFAIIFILVEGALRDGPDANPPYNMHKAFIFGGAFVTTIGSLVFLLRGKQARRVLDEQKISETKRQQ